MSIYDGNYDLRDEASVDAISETLVNRFAAEGVERK